MNRLSVQKEQGFTMVELLVVFALLVAIVAGLFTGFQNYLHYQQHAKAIQDMSTILETAQTNARLSVGGTAHGVKVETNSLIRFSGTVYNSGDPENVETNFANFTLTPNLSGGADEIVFTALSGLPSATGTITVTGVGYTTNIEVTQGGVVQ